MVLVEEAEAPIDAGKYDEALIPLLEAVEMGDAEAQTVLGNCYYYGYGVDQDYEEAVKWFQLAADQDDAGAQYNLGNCYYYGHGVDQDYDEADKYYKLAAEQGYSGGMFGVGDCYYAKEDRETAAEWYQKALDAGYEPDETDKEHLIAVLGEGCGS